MEYDFASYTMEIDLYCGIGEERWNHHSVAPGKYACVSPVMGNSIENRKVNRVFIPEGTQVIQDSGAFSDGPENRLPVEVALARQIMHAHRWKYADKITHVASYDLLIDERWENGKRFKERWQEDLAEIAVEETILNAKWLSEHRNSLPNSPSLVLSAQGVSPDQYTYCATQVVKYIQEGDIFGFGGWCITGKMRRCMMPVLAETLRKVMPILQEHHIKRVHVWGVILAEALAEFGYWCQQFDIHLSTDSVGPSIYPALGKWGYADWIDKTYKRPDPPIRGLERARHVKATAEWLSNFDVYKYLNPTYDNLRKT